MFERLSNAVKSCFQGKNYRRIEGGQSSRNTPRGASSSSSSSSVVKELNDPLLWSRSLEKHFGGDFSFAVLTGNNEIEDTSQVETSVDTTFVGIYDGHGGTEASLYVQDHLFENLIKEVQGRDKIMSEEAIKSAFKQTEDGFLGEVLEEFPTRPTVAAMGTCCLVGVLCGRKLYYANLGDSRAVLGVTTDDSGLAIYPEQLTQEHNASRKEERDKLKAEHPDDPSIVEHKSGVWRVKGRIQITRAIGDFFLKFPEIKLPSYLTRFELSTPLTRAVLKADPEIRCRELGPNDKFVIFASDGLWDQLSNEEAVQLVHTSDRKGIAKKLIKQAAKKAAEKQKKTYEYMVTNVGKADRRPYHDDITVVVLFFDRKTVTVYDLSMKGCADVFEPSKFKMLREKQSDKGKEKEVL